MTEGQGHVIMLQLIIVIFVLVLILQKIAK